MDTIASEMIEIRNITKHYDSVQVLAIPELNIAPGECIGVVGNNGAGKTTLFNLILDLIRPSTGEITNNGIPVHENESWKSFTAAFIDESFLIGYLTPEEYFYFVGELRGVNRASVDAMLAEYTHFFDGEILNRKKYLRDLSKGNQKKVGIVSTFIGDPAVIILDEPFANLDPTTQIRLKDILKTLAATKERTLLVSSHDLSHTVEVSDRIIVLDKGGVIKDLKVSPETLQELEMFFSA